MATLPPATTIASSYVDEALSRLPFLSEAASLRNLQKQRLPISHSKLNAPFSLRERSSTWRITAMAASAPQTKMPLGSAKGDEHIDEEDGEAAAQGSLFDWNSQWYPVSMIDDLDRRVPTAITIMGRHLVVSWDNFQRSWQVWDEATWQVLEEMTTPLANAQSSRKRNSQSSRLCGSLESSPQNDCGSVYPCVEQDGLLWFWPDKNLHSAATKPPPSLPALNDPAFKDKLYSMNLPYGYKKMIENILEPAYLPFAYDEPQVDLLEDFEKLLSRTTDHSSNNPSSAHAYMAKQKQHLSSITDGHAHEAENLASKNIKTVKNGSANGTPERSLDIYSKTNDSSNAFRELSHADEQNGGRGSATSSFGKSNGSTNEKMEIPYETKKSATLHRSTTTHRKTDGSATQAENYASIADSAKSPTSHAVLRKDSDGSPNKASRESFVQLTGGVLQSDEVLSQSGLGESIKEKVVVEEVRRTDELELAGEANVRRVQSSVILKKPVSSTRTKFEERVSATTDASTVNSESNQPKSLIRDGSQVSSLDLTSSLEAVRRLIFQKDFGLAKGRVKELYEKYPHDTGVLMEYAFIEKQLGDLVAAGSLYSKAIAAFEDQQNLGYDYVRALQALGSIEGRARNARRARVLFMESIRAARQAENLFPDLVSGASVYGLHAWARLELQVGNWAKARDLLTRAADIQPGNAVVHQSRALLEAKAHNWGEARHHFSLAVESAPKDVKCWHAWAIFEAGQGKQKKMRELFQKALEVEPYSIHCLQAWAHQETLIGTPESKDKARSLFQRCTEIEPKSLYAWQAWAVLEKSSGNHDKARELFEKCLDINSSSVACLQAFANMERHLKNWGSAQRLLRKALKLEPDNAAVLMEAAFVENSLGNTEVAERLFVLAGMADKRNSRVTNRIFASRKEVMPSKTGRGWLAFGQQAAQKPSTNFKDSVDVTEIKGKEGNTNFIKQRKFLPIKAAANPSQTKQEEIDSHLSMQRLSSTHFKHPDGGNRTDAALAKQRGFTKDSDGQRKPTSHLKPEGNTSTNYQVAIDVIKAKQRKKIKYRPNFEAAIDAIEGKLRKLNSDMEMEEQRTSPLSRAESAPSIQGT